MTQPDPADASPPSNDAVPPADADTGWQPLPPRARSLFLLSGAITWTLLGIVVAVALAIVRPFDLPVVALALAPLVLLPAFGTWLALKKYRYTHWRLDGEGFALRRGRFWRAETRVPASRVQHLDLVRGPLERSFDLATLVIHTAGTRHSAVSISGMDTQQAEHLRDVLARGTGDDDDHDA